MFVIGIDTHSQLHAAAALDEQGRVLAWLQVGATVSDLRRLLAWVATFDATRLVAVEGAKGYGHALSRELLAAGERVVNIATHLTAAGRLWSRRRGKGDAGDDDGIARVVLREADLPRLEEAAFDDDLKLRVDARDQLVSEANRTKSRLHALLIVCAPGHRLQTGSLANKQALAEAHCLGRARAAHPTRPRLVLAAIRRLRQIAAETPDCSRNSSA